MKKKHLISTLIACLLLTGCAADGSRNSPKVNFSDMFQPKASKSEVVQENRVSGEAASPLEESVIVTDDTNAVGEVRESAPSISSKDGLTVSKSRTAKAAPGGADQTQNNGSQTNNNTVSGSQNNAGQPTGNETSNTSTSTSVSVIDNRNPKSIFYTDAQAVADLSLGDICYFSYKTEDEEIPSDNTSETEDETEEDEGAEKVNKRPKPKYNYGYRVVFRTESDTYLLGITPYDHCKWDDVNDMCLKIADQIEAECEMVGIPSFDDLRYFTDRGIYLPGKYEMWTQSPATPDGKKVYYRNEKGAFYSTKSKTQSSGVCALIKISASQNDSELLSSSLADYDEAKTRLEAEEEQFKAATSEE